MFPDLTLLYKDDFITIKYDKTNNCLVTARQGYPNVDAVKNSLNKTLGYIQQYKCNKIISDMRSIKGTWTASNEWIGKEWMPKAIAAGLKYVAYVYPPDVFGQFALQDLIKKNSQYSLQIFKDPQEARSWVLSNE